MALDDLLASTEKSVFSTKKKEVDKESIKRNIEKYQLLISYWRWYPDRFVDFLCGLNPDNTFTLHMSQRIFLRILFRYKMVYGTFSRGFSKSFLSTLGNELKAVLYPGATLGTAAGQKEQSAKILGSKLQEIAKLCPALNDEIMWDTKGKAERTTNTKSEVVYSFVNGSSLSNVSMQEGARGQRYHGIIVEEAAKTEGRALSEIILPMLVVSRQVNGRSDPDEILNQSQIYVTSAGYRGTDPYDKLVTAFIRMVLMPGSAFVFGGDWRLPVVEGLQPLDYIQSQEEDESMDEDGYEREYMSKWSGVSDGVFFSPDKFDELRIVNTAETQFSKRGNDKSYYVIGVDVARASGDCTTEMMVVKVTPSNTGVPIKQIVNMYSYEAEHFGLQSIQIKRLINKYHADMCVVDSNGLGIGLVDFLITDQLDPDTGEMLYNLGIANLNDLKEDDRKKYKAFETKDTKKNVLYMMKANAVINSELYSYLQSQMLSGKILFLADEAIPKNRLLTSDKGKKMSAGERADYMRPYQATSILKGQLTNLVQKNEGANIKLEQYNKNIPKDKVSALIYALSWAKYREDHAKSRRSRNVSDFIMFTPRK